MAPTIRILNKTEYTPTVTGTPSNSTTFGSSRATPDVQISNPEIAAQRGRFNWVSS